MTSGTVPSCAASSACVYQRGRISTSPSLWVRIKRARRPVTGRSERFLDEPHQRHKMAGHRLEQALGEVGGLAEQSDHSFSSEQPHPHRLERDRGR